MRLEQAVHLLVWFHISSWCRAGPKPDLLTQSDRGALGQPHGSWRATFPKGHQWKSAECPRNSKLSLKNLELLKFPEQQELKVRAVKVLVAPSCLTLCDSMNCSLPVSSAHGILQARILEWVAIPFSRGSSWPTYEIQVSHIGRKILHHSATREAQKSGQWVAILSS